MSKKLILTILITAFIGMFVIQPKLSALDDTSSLECDGGTVHKATQKTACGTNAATLRK